MKMYAMLLFVVLGTSASAAELWVDSSATTEGDGSSSAPLRSINDALKAARGGDTITIRGGTYRESVVVGVSGSATQPTVLRAAAGERVILSGFAPIRDWKPKEGGVYSAAVDGTPGDLYVGLQPQGVARWPDLDQPLRHVKDADQKAGSFHDSQSLPDEPPLKELAADVKSAMAFLFVAQSNTFTTIPVAGVDLRAGQVTLRATSSLGRVQGKSDRYQLVNHPSLIRKPGQWAFVTSGEQTRIYFRPCQPSDLGRTQYRRQPRQMLVVGHHGETVSHVRIEGLEICGSAKDGLRIERCRDVVVSHCIVHNNAGVGLASRRSDDVKFKNNIVMANHNGIGIVSAQNALVEGNEVALNMVDGIDVAGNVTGRPGGEPTSQGVTIRRNYFHHHMLLGHPDNVQAYRGVKDFTIEDNVLLFGGQGIMTEEVDGGAVRNCVVVGTGAVAVIFGHGNSNDWAVRNVTVGLGGWGVFSLTGKNYRLQDNILWNNMLAMTESLSSDYNLFYFVDDRQRMAVMPRPKWRDFQTPAEVAAATGQERHSRRMHPQFRNAPHCQAVAMWDDSNRSDRLVLRLSRNTASGLGFEDGDLVEINGDGLGRRVVAVEPDAIRIDPPLPRRPFRSALIWNWKKAASLTLDLRPPADGIARTAGQDFKPAGADLDIPAFQRGDFDADGQRDIPPLPNDLRSALPNPNAIVVPLHGS